MVDETLIARCKAEDRKAQSELYRVLHGWMLGICLRYTKDRQEAVARMNKGFLKILTKLDERRSDVPFGLWARRILINTTIDAHRQEKRRTAMERAEEEAPEIDHSEVNAYLHTMETEAFAALLQRVPEMSRKAFNLHVVDGYAHAEVADLLGISEGTSKWHVAHARQVLRNAIGQLAGKVTKTHLT